MYTQAEPFFVRFRLPLIVLFNALITAFGYYLALGLRFDFAIEEIAPPERLFVPVLLLITVRGWAYIAFNLNQGYWRYSSTHDLVRLFQAHVLSSVIFAALILLLRVSGFPRSVIFSEFFISILLSGGSRFAVRLLSEKFLSDAMAAARGNDREVIVIGAGDSGHLVVKNLLSHRRISYEPVAVLDDSERVIGSSVFGVPVFGPLSSLERCLTAFPYVSAVIIAIPSLSAARERELAEVCNRIGVAVKRLQSFEDIACADADGPRDGISIESVLQKEITIEHENEIRDSLRGKRVLVTGAGGSIGSEIVRQLLKFKPASVILFDNSEYNLFQMSRELGEQGGDTDVCFCLGSICDVGRLESVFRQFSPDVVFHAAAYKHVPLMEFNPYVAFRNNVLGTRRLLDASLKFHVSRFVLISTDKAVQPTNIMGATKRIAELLVRSYASGPAGVNLNAAVVRFGNVINSSGSVIPIFKQQIFSGGPVTVTHPEMERFFMSIREAVRLVLMAGMLGDRGEIFVLDMGKPIKVVDVARKMLALYGRRDIEIVFTGIRPGEKLTEELTGENEQIAPTSFRKVNRVSGTMSDEMLGEVIFWVSEMESKIPTLNDVELRNLILNFINTDSRSLTIEKSVVNLSSRESVQTPMNASSVEYRTRND